jgi:CheY-like chemotaxis protein
MGAERCIMIVDDDADDRMLFEDALKEVSTETRLISLKDGMDLMDVLTRENTPGPDVIFLDINMPGKNGFECLASIRSSPLLKDIPIILYSTCSQEETINKAYSSGANLYVSKPNNFNTLKKIISKILSNDFKNSIARNQFVVSG